MDQIIRHLSNSWRGSSMSQLKLTADSGGGTVAIKGPASTAGNAAIELTVPGTGHATLAPQQIALVKFCKFNMP